ncbi:MAG: ATP-binding protein [candidate division WOR-3 bacterium]|nr:ATP-binding protein [candidate division WOR-3 bacterium]
MRVSHPVFGSGDLLTTRKSSAGPQIECLVQFDSGLRLWIPASRIEGIPEELLQELKPFEELKGEALKIKAHRMIEAFRLGIVPMEDVADFTFGRDKEINLVTSALNKLTDGQGGVIIFEGEYGTGKSHLLEYIRAQALKKNFVVSLIELSLDETQPARPKRIYREMLANLRYLIKDHSNSNREAGFRELMRFATKEYGPPNYLGIQDHIFFAPVLSRLSKIDHHSLKAEVFWQWIEAESTKEYATGITKKGERPFTMPYRISGAYNIPALYDFSTASDFYCYLISGLSYLIRSLKYNGLVLLLDEVETIAFLWDNFFYERGVNFLEGLIRLAQNDPTLKTIDSRLIHNQVRPTPYIYKDAYVLLVLATTPEPQTIRLKNLCRNIISLSPLKREDLRNCYEALVKYYKIAYPDFILSDQTKNQILSNALRQADNGIRYFIKFSVESLDVLRIGRKSSSKKSIV